MSSVHSDPQTVVHVSSAHPYIDNRIHYRECRSLVEAGFDVTLIAIDSELPGEESGARVVKLARRSRLRRMLFSSFHAAWLAWRSKARVVHLHDPELIPYIPVLRLTGRVVVYDAHEDLPIQILYKPYVARWNRWVFAGIARAIVSIARSADLIVAATETIAERFPAEKTILVRNFPPLRAEEANLAESPISREDMAVYIGGMSRKRGTVSMLEAVENPEFPEGWSLHLAGPLSSDVRDIVRQAAARGRVTYHGQLPPSAARDLLLRAKVGVVTLQNTRAYRESLPTKMFEYFAAALPAVASDFPIWRNIIDSGECGILVDETNPSAIAQAIARYAHDPELLADHSENARRVAVEELNWAPEGKVLVAAYSRIYPA